MFPFNRTVDGILKSLDQTLADLVRVVDEQDSVANTFVAESVRMACRADIARQESERARKAIGLIDKVRNGLSD